MKKKILIVEDDRTTRLFLREVLTAAGFAGIDRGQWCNGVEASALG